MNPTTGHLVNSNRLNELGSKFETHVNLTQTKKNRLATLCEQWRKAGFTKCRIRKHNSLNYDNKAILNNKKGGNNGVTCKGI